MLDPKKKKVQGRHHPDYTGGAKAGTSKANSYFSGEGI
jgi:hypothetical protein